MESWCKDRELFGDGKYHLLKLIDFSNQQVFSKTSIIFTAAKYSLIEVIYYYYEQV